NLYPFTQTISQPGVSLEQALEQIDIGGVTLLRAAAKNFQDVVVVVRPSDYETVLRELQEHEAVHLERGRLLAAYAFQHSASYDTHIATYLRQLDSNLFPDELTVALEKIQPLR